MKREIQSEIFSVPCDLCGTSAREFVLTTPRLDGPLVRCTNCGLYYVLLPTAENFSACTPDISDSTQAAAEMKRLATRAQELFLVDTYVEENEKKWHMFTATERLNDLRRRTPATSSPTKRLLEIGCSIGDFLNVASSSFQVTGVEADEAACALAQARGFDCFNGTLFDAAFPEAHFDVVALYHVIEHVPSPSRLLQEIHRVLRPQGWLVIETPNINNFWFRLLGARWRQFIPDHKFFFTPTTIRRLCAESGFETSSLHSVGKAMSGRLFVNRLSRYHRPTAHLLARLSTRLGWDERTLQICLGDVLRIYAQRQ